MDADVSTGLNQLMNTVLMPTYSIHSNDVLTQCHNNIVCDYSLTDLYGVQYDDSVVVHQSGIIFTQGGNN